MNIICWLFGHKPPQYARRRGRGGYEYCDLKHQYADGIGRVHVDVYGECARCEKEFQVGRAHLPETTEPQP